MKLRKMKRDLADKADDRQGEPVKGNWPMAKGALAKLCETPCWKTINLGLSVWRIRLRGKSFLPVEGACQEAAPQGAPLEKGIVSGLVPNIKRMGMRRKGSQ